MKNIIKINEKLFAKLFRFAMLIFVVSYLILIPIFVLPKFSNQIESNKQNLDYIGVLDLWHIETFEGGSANRGAWLEKRAIEFEKQHKGCYIVVNTISVEQLKLNIAENKCPAMFSFGIGVGDIILNNLQEYSGVVNVRDDLINSGCFGNKVMAVPYMLGGYVVASTASIEKSQKQILFGGKDYNNFALSLALNGYTAESVDNSLNLDSFSVYDAYINQNISTICGTQRDAFRINNRINNGKMQNQNLEYLGEFSDLIQYLAIGKTTAKEKQIVSEFIEYVTSSSCQNTLSNIGMFSVANQKIYNSSYLNEMENKLIKHLKTISVFVDEKVLQLIKDVSNDCLLKKQNLNSIEKYLIK